MNRKERRAVSKKPLNSGASLSTSLTDHSMSGSTNPDSTGNTSSLPAQSADFCAPVGTILNAPLSSDHEPTPSSLEDLKLSSQTPPALKRARMSAADSEPLSALPAVDQPVLKSITPLPTLEVTQYYTRGLKLTDQHQVCAYTVDVDRSVHVCSDLSSLRLYRPPKLPIDLNDGFETFVTKEFGSIEHLLQAIQQAKLSLDGVDFVSYRNNFNKIFQAPYTKEGWKIGVHRLAGGVIFLNVCESEPFSTLSGEQKRSCYWGYKFEQMATVTVEADGSISEHSNEAVNPNREYCRVVSFFLGHFKILLGAEIDAYEFASADRTRTNLIEFKTNKELLTDRDKFYFRRYKMLKYWIQSYLGGVPEVIVGFRDCNGQVKQVDRFHSCDLPRMAFDCDKSRRDDMKPLWSPLVCLTFALRLLDWLKRNTVDGQQYVLEYAEPYRQVRLLARHDDSFLPADFVSNFHTAAER